MVRTQSPTAAASVFVAMVSPPAWRAGPTMDDAIGEIMGGMGTAFDRPVAVVLVNYLDNHGGRAEWDRRAGEQLPR